MPSPNPRPRAAPPKSDYQLLAEEWKRAKRVQEIEQADLAGADVHAEQEAAARKQAAREKLSARRRAGYSSRWRWTTAFWAWMLCVHAVGIYLFTSGFLLTRLVLEEQSECGTPPPVEGGTGREWEGKGTPEAGCWHPRAFRKAVVVLIDALRYDFTVPVGGDAAEVYHNAFPFMYETAASRPEHAFLRPFIADPPTTTLQRLKGLTTGTLPTFVDVGSNFAGTAIEEDNLLGQMREAGRKIVHLGDDTWLALFPGYFEANASRAYDSFNVWDLHTVDDGVIEHIFPLMEPERKGEWDLLIGHCLGVDHAGHRYGPDHPAMAAKLRQMDGFVRNLTELVDDDTLLVVMGDHGMDAKGDHGGESDDEVEAALWMYSRRPFFGRTAPEFATPPATAKIRPTNQIDLVPTLALLLGIPIPYNNLGTPIEEAFVGGGGKKTKSGVGQDWGNLAAATRTAAAGIRRYQTSYFSARGLQAYEPEDVVEATGAMSSVWKRAEAAAKIGDENEAYAAFGKYQERTLQRCRELWARFDVPRMVVGIVVMAAAVLVILAYASSSDADFGGGEDSGEVTSATAAVALPLQYRLATGIASGGGMGTALALLVRAASRAAGTEAFDWPYVGVGAALGSMFSVLAALKPASLRRLVPRTFWGWMAAVFTIAQSVGFASNSYTIWEDNILLFFLATFGLASAAAALRVPDRTTRTLALAQSVQFVVLSRLASFSQLCRDEQMPYCESTYYSSAGSSTAAAWHLAVPLVAFLALPRIVASYLRATNSYESTARTWVGYCFRTALFMGLAFWTLEAADNGEWIPGVPQETLKTVRVWVAQLALGLAFVVGSAAFATAAPCTEIGRTLETAEGHRIEVRGYDNAHGARYALLVVNFVAGCVLLSKPMGGGALGLFLWQLLALAEMADANGLAGEAVGPVVVAMLGNFHFFRTGHQAALSSIQWDSAFIPLFQIRYPWSPLVLALNTFAGQVVAAVAVPLLVVWRADPKRTGLLERASRAWAAFAAYFAVEALATMAWAGHLRRHLMLYRVFSPRFMMAAALLLLVDVVGVVVTLPGVRFNTFAVSEVFGWTD